MRLRSEAWDLVPNFSLKLADAMGHAGLSATDLSKRLTDLGVETSPQYLRALMRGGTDGRPPNPTLILIAAIARACDVPVDWFFSRSQLALPEAIRRYTDTLRSSPTSGVPHRPELPG